MESLCVLVVLESLILSVVVQDPTIAARRQHKEGELYGAVDRMNKLEVIKHSSAKSGEGVRIDKQSPTSNQKAQSASRFRFGTDSSDEDLEAELDIQYDAGYLSGVNKQLACTNICQKVCTTFPLQISVYADDVQV